MAYRQESPRKPGFAVRLLMGLVLIPLGIMLRVLSQIYLEITPEAVHYFGLMGMVAIGHVVLISLTVLAALQYRRKPIAVIAAVQLWIGYGIGAGLLILKDMG